ncbi:MAG TPA: hypothetical protein VKB79_17145 [Bryobacteraceae bacterium]|nr:hypothetical protein [Bryobacteraceae bacterium]
MRRILHNVLYCGLGLATLCSVGPAFSQGYYDRSYPAPGAVRTDHSMFDRVRMDLDRAANYPYSSRGDRKRFDEARRGLFDFEARFDRGVYDKHDFDRVIERVQNVAAHNSLDPRDRGALDEDLRRMRDFRNLRDHNWR